MAYVVVGKDVEKNRLIVGWDRPDSGELYARECVVGTMSSLGVDFDRRQRIEAQPRYRAKAEPAIMEPCGDGKVALRFEHPQRAIAPGQICAFYEGGRLLGGGVFESAR
jgi:tRNA-specific 2-thiouridylase